jgi:hypothetical protein
MSKGLGLWQRLILEHLESDVGFPLREFWRLLRPERGLPLIALGWQPRPNLQNLHPPCDSGRRSNQPQYKRLIVPTSPHLAGVSLPPAAKSLKPLRHPLTTELSELGALSGLSRPAQAGQRPHVCLKLLNTVAQSPSASSAARHPVTDCRHDDDEKDDGRNDLVCGYGGCDQVNRHLASLAAQPAVLAWPRIDPNEPTLRIDVAGGELRGAPTSCRIAAT